MSARQRIGSAVCRTLYRGQQSRELEDRMGGVYRGQQSREQEPVGRRTGFSKVVIRVEDRGQQGQWLSNSSFMTVSPGEQHREGEEERQT